MQFLRISFFVQILILLAPGLYADFLMKPLEVRNQFVLYLPHLFMPLEDSKVLEEGKNEVRFSFYKASTYFDSNVFKNTNEAIDVETTAVTLSYLRSLGNNWEVRMALPYYYHGGGYLDPIIEDFHHLFPFQEGGLPNGGREFGPDNRMRISFNEGKGSVDIEHAVYGVGDPSFYVKKQLFAGVFGMSLLAGVKFPLGQQPFIHSKTTDIGLSLNFDWTFNWLYLYTMIGGVYFIGESQYGKEFNQNKDYLIDWAAGVGLKLSQAVGIFMQFYFQTSPYDTGIDRIDHVSILHSFGVRWKWTDSFLIQFSADEDTFTYATCDITFHLQAEYRF